MCAVEREPHDAVLGPSLPDDLKQWPSLPVRHIGQPHAFMPLGYAVVEPLEHGLESHCEGGAPFVDEGAFACHLLFPQFHQFRVGLLLGLQHGISLHQGLVVSHQTFQIHGVALRNHHVHESPALFAASVDELLVGGRNHHQRYQPYVLRQLAIGLLSPSHHFFLSTFQTAVDVLGRTVLVAVSSL